MTLKIKPLLSAVEIGHIVNAAEFRKLEQYHEELKERIGIADLCIPFDKRFSALKPYPKENQKLNHPEKSDLIFQPDVLIKDDSFWKQKRTWSVIKNIQKRMDLRSIDESWSEIAAARDAIERELFMLQIRFLPNHSSKHAYERLPFIIFTIAPSLFYDFQRNGQIATEKPLRVTI